MSQGVNKCLSVGVNGNSEWQFLFVQLHSYLSTGSDIYSNLSLGIKFSHYAPGVNDLNVVSIHVGKRTKFFVLEVKHRLTVHPMGMTFNPNSVLWVLKFMSAIGGGSRLTDTAQNHTQDKG